MLERPEAVVIARQLGANLKGRRVNKVVVDQNPHKLAWLSEDRSVYGALLNGQILTEAKAYGGMVEISFGKNRLLIGDGVNARLWQGPVPQKIKHQLLLGFEEGTALTFGVQMYGGIWCYPEGENDNPYFKLAVDRPSLDSEAFTFDYFADLAAGCQKLSLKAFLATEQRIPGLGNGVLQDMLFVAGCHPKSRVGQLNQADLMRLYEALRQTCQLMIEHGGRDVELDLYGRPGCYQTTMSKANAAQRCPRCGGLIAKESYMGGSIYYCPTCQPII